MNVDHPTRLSRASSPWSSARLIIACVALALLLAVLIQFALFLKESIMPNAVMVLTLKWTVSESKAPGAYAVPVPRMVKAIAPLPSGTRYSHFGLSYRLPWHGPPVKEESLPEKDGQGGHFMVFNGERGIVVLSDFPDLRKAFEAERPRSSKREREALDQMRKHFSLNSKYDAYASVLNSTPNQIKWSTPQPEAAARMALVIMKACMCEGLRRGELYSFRTDYIRGFQLGGESKVHKTIYAFDAKDRGYEMVITGSQEEIDYILSSVRIDEQKQHSPE